jgi:hypothetical protein
MSHASNGVVPLASVGGLVSSVGDHGGDSVGGSVSVSKEAGVGGGGGGSMEDGDVDSDNAAEVGDEIEEAGMASAVANVGGVAAGDSEDAGDGGGMANDVADEDAGDGRGMVNDAAIEDADMDTYVDADAGSNADANEGADAGVEGNGSGGDGGGVVNHGPLAGDVATSQHQANVTPGLHISRLL